MKKDDKTRKMSVLKLSNHFFRRYALMVITIGVIYASFLLIALLISFFDSFALIILFPLVIIPATFATQLCVTRIVEGKHFEFGHYFKSYAIYFTKSCSGGYRVLLAILKAIGVFFAVLILSFIIYSFCDPTFAGVINNFALSQNESIDAVETLTSKIQSIPNIYLGMKIIYIVSIACATLMFFHSVGVSSLNINISISSPVAVPMRGVIRVFNFAFKRIRKEFYKEYYKAVWFMPIVILIAFGLGAFIGFIANFEIDQIAIIALAVVTLVLIFLAPFYFIVIERLYYHFLQDFTKASYDLSVKDIERMKRMQKLSEDEAKELDDAIKNAEEMMKNVKSDQGIVDAKSVDEDDEQDETDDDDDNGSEE